MTQQPPEINGNSEEILRSLLRHVREVESKVTIAKDATEEIEKTAKEAKSLAERQGRQIRRNRRVNVALLFLAVGMIFALWRVDEALDQIQDTARTNCESGNNRVEQQQKAWTYLIDVSSSQQENREDPVLNEWFKDYRAWIVAVFSQRDCNKLEEEVVYPDQPAFPQIDPKTGKGIPPEPEQEGEASE